MRKSLAAEALSSALKNLGSELRTMQRNEKSFLGAYRRARLSAFHLEFLAKFLRKSKSANREIFEILHGCTKELEDRLGGFNETDELLAYCEKLELMLRDGIPAAEVLRENRHKEWKTLSTWLKTSGWYAEKMAEMDSLLERLEDYEPRKLRQAALAKMAKVAGELQSAVENGEYSPRKKSGYELSEVESKVHELRREIRKIPMYASYLSGLFTLTSENVPATRPFRALAKTEIAKSDYARLPKAKAKHPLKLSRFHYLAINRYVLELGAAKDWAQNLARLRDLGLKGDISFDQLDLSLKDAFGQPVPFNPLVRRITEEIRSTRLFGAMAEALESQR